MVDYQPAFTAFYKAHREPVLRFARHYGAKHLDVEAIVAEAWARAYAIWPSLADPRPWLYRVVMNLIHDAGRAAMQTVPVEDPYTTSGRPPVWVSAAKLPGAEWAARVSEVTAALQRLPAQQRAAVLLDYQGVPRAEIAAALECSTVTVRGHLHRGRARLRRMLEEPAVDPHPARDTGLEGRRPA
jgi:RNA polymerase sigma factor (sigma-70 family)